MMKTPKELGYRFPAEWEPHAATWLSWPHKEASWPGMLKQVLPDYARFVKVIAEAEEVCINVNNETMRGEAIDYLTKADVALDNIRFFIHPTNDAWCRDHGPAFLTRNSLIDPKAVVNWNYNAWGGKYPPFDLDNEIPQLIARARNIPIFNPSIVMEGGSIECNGLGTLLTTKSCLLNTNRNPHLSQSQIESYLKNFYCAEHILWLEKGIEGDDTDGHIDDITRFVSAETVVTLLPDDSRHPDYNVLSRNLKALEKMKLENGNPLQAIRLPVPRIYEVDGQILPCSYANFYICNQAVIVPTFNDPNDEQALNILSDCFKDRQVTGINSKAIIWGLGSFHCLSQQEPF